MSSPPHDLCAIGNALIDILIPADDDFLRAYSISKGTMTLVDHARAEKLYVNTEGRVEMSSGGSAANTMAGFASLGGKGAYLGKIGRDKFGEIFTRDLRAQKIDFATPPSADLPSGHCIIFVTPDAQRSMNTYLGAAVEFGPEDVDVEIVRHAQITYLEGYLFDKPQAQKAFRHAAHLAHEAGRQLALTLSDTFCVERHASAFLDLVVNEVDILFANEDEIKELYTTDDLQKALAAARGHVDTVVVTRGKQGAVIVKGSETYEIPAYPVPFVIDTTGAGDLYAAGFLFGLTQGKTMLESGMIGAIAAAEVISHYGPRPQKKLSGLI